MKNRKVKHARFHAGVQLNHQVKTSVDALKDGVELSVTPVGLLIAAATEEVMVPWANVYQTMLFPEDATEK